jgi:glycosyltransferase involved in cell wall biosynthesis
MSVYNGEKYINEAIESILNQTLINFEFIIFNEGSNDRTSEIIKSYADVDKRIVFIDRNEKRSLPLTLNEGLSIAKGKYIARMDADDISLNNRFELQFNFLEKNPHIYLLGSSYIVFNSKGILKEVKHPTKPIELAYRSISNTYFCHPTIMFRSEIIQLVGFYENIEAEDFRYFSKIAIKYPCSNIPISLLKYREHETNRSFVYKKDIVNSLVETTKSNITNYFSNYRNRRVYLDYRLEQNKSVIHFFLCYILDIIVVLKILKQHKKKKFYFQGVELLICIALDNLKRFFTYIIKK